jgi:hypothetical protein
VSSSSTTKVDKHKKYILKRKRIVLTWAWGLAVLT